MSVKILDEALTHLYLAEEVLDETGTAYPQALLDAIEQLEEMLYEAAMEEKAAEEKAAEKKEDAHDLFTRLTLF